MVNPSGKRRPGRPRKARGAKREDPAVRAESEPEPEKPVQEAEMMDISVESNLDDTVPVNKADEKAELSGLSELSELDPYNFGSDNDKVDDGERGRDCNHSHLFHFLGYNQGGNGRRTFRGCL